MVAKTERRCDRTGCDRLATRGLGLRHGAEPLVALCEACWLQATPLTCVLCGREQQSDPGRRSNWRAVILDTRTYYACPGHFPPDGSDAEAFEAAYYRFLRRALETHRA